MEEFDLLRAIIINFFFYFQYCKRLCSERIYKKSLKLAILAKAFFNHGPKE